MTVAIEQPAQTRPAPESDLLEAIRTRRSIGRVRPESPPRELVEQLLEAATWAPNHRLTEPWHFFVLAGDARRELGDVMARSLDAVLPSDASDRQAQLDKARAKPLRAPVIIAVGVVPQEGPKVIEVEEVLAGGAAVQNLLLAAHDRGLAAMWRTGEPAYDPAVKAFLGLPPNAHLIGFVYVGYPDAPPSQKRRRPAAECTRWLGWDDAASE